MKGDIILMPDSSDITLQKILDKKKEVELAINREEYEACEGCPYIERFEKKVEEKINYISLENYTYCNMKCSYCSPKYYSGREALYDTYGIISDLIKGNHLDKLHVVWGGGEPTLSPKFYEITNDLLSNKDVSIVSTTVRYALLQA
jgi:sulfatase maturation enzyme AslB (radical SAM superfamily)